MTKVNLASYMCIVMDSDAQYDSQVEFCKVVKVNPSYVSEVIEIGKILVKCPIKLYDEVITFVTGRKKVLVEKTANPKNLIFKKFEIICFEEDLSGVFYLRTNVNKLVMANGNHYYVFAD